MHIEPVFVDASGRRRRLIRRSGLAAGVALTVFMAMLVIGVATGSGVPLTPWSAPEKNPLGAGVTPGDHPKLYAKGGSQASGPQARPSGSGGVATPGRSAPTGTGTGTRPLGTQTSPAVGTTTQPTSPAVPTTSNPVASHSPPAWGRHKKSPAP